MAWNSSPKYIPLRSQSPESLKHRSREIFDYFQGTALHIPLTSFSLCLNALLLVLLGKSWLLSGPPPYKSLYSPAQNSLSYEEVVFRGDFGLNTSAYSGYPNEKNNEAWKELYNFGVSRISAAEAKNMANKTLPIPGDEENYIVSLSVFHQLHCLNRVRLAVYGDVDWTDISDSTGITHIDHCINALRQSLMCSADITPIIWSRNLVRDRAVEVMEVVHTCRNFDSVKEWGLQKQLKTSFNFTTIVDSDPLGWGDTHL